MTKVRKFIFSKIPSLRGLVTPMQALTAVQALALATVCYGVAFYSVGAALIVGGLAVIFAVERNI